MGFFKKLGKKLKNPAKVAKHVLRVVDPIMGKKIGDKLLPNEGAAAGAPDPGKDLFGNPLQGSEFYQGELEKEQGNYRNAPTTALEAATADAKRAGTYSDTREGGASLQAEGGARARGLQGSSMNRINLLRKQLGLPESETI